ncbi:acetyltransferase [Paenibacillus baekrokdamisoli]|uniref:Acetyltransferase n=2 Tax=Paenibacillus baekrokdamisoli TaxID=1712516 RepID=A0A3G9J808_9BACL|nr:acetyltransferase [Paenibacillus baekrokdamisoli]
MIEIIDVNADNVEETGFFCMRSKPKTVGYQQKLHWLKERFSEGLKLKVIQDGDHPKGFIEYVPSEYTWRTVEAENFIIIHCLWIVGQGKGKGYGSRLLEECIKEAVDQKKSGIAMVTSKGTWLADPSFFTNKGFKVEDEAPPAFELIVRKFVDCPSPRFPNNWVERAEQYKSGITILRSDQCPYNDSAVQTISETAKELGIDVNVIEINNCKDAQGSPSAYGTFNVIYNGKLLTYHPITKRELLKLLQEAT